MKTSRKTAKGLKWATSLLLAFVLMFSAVVPSVSAADLDFTNNSSQAGEAADEAQAPDFSADTDEAQAPDFSADTDEAQTPDFSEDTDQAQAPDSNPEPTISAETEALAKQSVPNATQRTEKFDVSSSSNWKDECDPQSVAEGTLYTNKKGENWSVLEKTGGHYCAYLNNVDFNIECEHNAVAVEGDIEIIGGKVNANALETSSNDAGLNVTGNLTISGGADVTAKTADDYGIYAENDITISGVGTKVTATTPDCDAIRSESGSVTIKEGADVTAKSEGDDGIYANKDVTIDEAKVEATGYDYGIYSNGGSLTISGSSSDVVAKEDQCGSVIVTHPGTGIYIPSGNVTISGGKVQAIGGNSSYDEDAGIYVASGTMTVSGGADVTARTVDDYGIYVNSDITISGVGTKVDAYSPDCDGIRSNTGSVTIKEGADVNATSVDDYGIYANKGVTIDGAKVDATGYDYGIYSSGGNLTISGSSSDVVADVVSTPEDKNPGSGIYIPSGNVIISGGKVWAEGGKSNENDAGIYTSGTVTVSGGAKVTAKTVEDEGIYAGSDITISGVGTKVKATTQDPGGIRSNGGSVTIKEGADVTVEAYRPSPSAILFAAIHANKDVTISGAKVHVDAACYGIYSLGGSLTISSSDVFVKTWDSDSTAIYMFTGNVTISGGKVQAIGQHGSCADDAGIYVKGGTMTVSGGADVTAKTDDDYGIFVEKDITISGVGTKVTATSPDCDGIMSNGGSVTIKEGADVTATSAEDNGIIAHRDVTIDGAKVTATGYDYGVYTQGRLIVTNGGRLDAQGSDYAVAVSNGIDIATDLKMWSKDRSTEAEVYKYWPSGWYYFCTKGAGPYVAHVVVSRDGNDAEGSGAYPNDDSNGGATNTAGQITTETGTNSADNTTSSKLTGADNPARATTTGNKLTGANKTANVITTGVNTGDNSMWLIAGAVVALLLAGAGVLVVTRRKKQSPEQGEER